MNDEQRRQALAEFLRTRRARLSPEQVGLPTGMRRRTPGLRREEVAQLANVSSAWYTYLEQGREIRVSKSVLDGIAHALQLTAHERQHLFVLADQALPVIPTTEIVRPVYQRTLDQLGAAPAYMTGRYSNIIAWNQAASAVFGDFDAVPESERNFLWLLFT